MSSTDRSVVYLRPCKKGESRKADVGVREQCSRPSTSHQYRTRREAIKLTSTSISLLPTSLFPAFSGCSISPSQMCEYSLGFFLLASRTSSAVGDGGSVRETTSVQYERRIARFVQAAGGGHRYREDDRKSRRRRYQHGTLSAIVQRAKGEGGEGRGVE